MNKFQINVTIDHHPKKKNYPTKKTLKITNPTQRKKSLPKKTKKKINKFTIILQN